MENVEASVPVSGPKGWHTWLIMGFLAFSLVTSWWQGSGHSQDIDDLRQQMYQGFDRIETQMDDNFEEVDDRLDDLSERMARVETKVDNIDQRVIRIEGILDGQRPAPVK